MPSFGASQPLQQQQQQQQQLQQTHFPTPSAMGRPSLPVPNASPANGNTPGIWGMGGVGAGAPGTWAPLSTNPNSMTTAGWLSTRVPDIDVASQPMSSTAASHVGLSSSSGSSAHYSMPMPTASGNGLWTSPAGTSSTATSASMMLPASMMPLSMATAGGLPMMQMMQQEKPKFQNQLRAEATPYVPMNLNVGVPAY